MQRVLEPEVMDTWEESVAYDAMDFTVINKAFAERTIALAPESALVLDAGTGTARIPILLCQQRPQWQVIGIDRSKMMLQIGAANVKQAGLQAQITLADEDASQLPYPDDYFDAVVSNSLVHHLPEPLPFLQELKRVLKPHGAIVLRDLLRPMDFATVDALVGSIGDGYDAHQQKLF